MSARAARGVEGELKRTANDSWLIGLDFLANGGLVARGDKRVDGRSGAKSPRGVVSGRAQIGNGQIPRVWLAPA